MKTDKINKQDLEIVRQLKTHLMSAFNEDIDRILLIGSRAKGTSKQESDFDIIIILNLINYNWHYKNKIIDAIYDFELAHNIIVDVHIISNTELNTSRRGINHFLKALLKKE